MSDPRRVLVIAPHADDEVLGCGGAIQHHRAQGDRVFVNIVSNRVLNHQADPAYIEETKRSAASAAKLLGIEQVFFGDLPDERLDDLLIDVIVPIERVVEAVKPHLVFIPNRDDAAPDHRAVSAACEVACRWINTVLMYEVPGPSKHFQPNCYLEITPYLDTKIRAMGCYPGEWRPYPHPRSPEGLRIHAQARGLECQAAMAEAYRLVKHVQRHAERGSR